MKIAICFNGQIRDGVECSKSILNYIGELKNDCDFFVHTWDIETISHNTHLPSDRHHFTQYPVEESKFDSFKEIYKPKKMVVEEFNSTQVQNIQGGLRFNKKLNKNVVAMFESAFYSNELKKEYEKENNFKYDFAIKMRPDLVFSNTKNLKDDLEQCNDETFLYGAHAECYGHARVEDVLWFATSKNMDNISNFYDHYGDSRSCWQIAAAHYISANCRQHIKCLNNNDFTVYYNQYKTHFNWDPVDDSLKCIKYFKDLCESVKRR